MIVHVAATAPIGGIDETAQRVARRVWAPRARRPRRRPWRGGRALLPDAPLRTIDGRLAEMTCLTSLAAESQASPQMEQLKRPACTARPLRTAAVLAALIRAKRSWGASSSPSSRR